MKREIQLDLIPHLPPIVKCPRCGGKVHRSQLNWSMYRCRRCRITFEYCDQAEPKQARRGK